MCRPGWKQALIAARNLDDLVRLRRVRDRIDREYARPLNVEELARAAGVTAACLSRDFRRAYGVSPYGYVMDRRVERAGVLLRRGDLTVSEVCFAVGCHSPAAFRARFTRLFGMPPLAYQQSAGPGGVSRMSRIREARAPLADLA